MINVFQPSLGDQEVEALRTTFSTNWIGRGPKTAAFEKAWADHVGVSVDNVQSVSTCTDGLFAIMDVVLSAGDNVVMPSISFVGAANAVLAAGCDVVFCDVDYRTLNPTLSHIEAVANENTRAVVLLHYGGVPCAELGEIAAWCKKHNIYLVEDCACAPASIYNRTHVGTVGDFGVWSFDAMKIMSTGDGGMIYCKDKAHHDQIASYLFFGLTSKSGFTSKAKTRWWEFDVHYPGRNAVMNDIESTIGLVQLGKLASFVWWRKQLYIQYSLRLTGWDWFTTAMPIVPKDTISSYYLYWIQTEHRDELAAYLRENEVYVTFRYYPLHKVELYGQTRRTDLRTSNRVADQTICLPLHQGMTLDDVNKICDLIIGLGANL